MTLPIHTSFLNDVRSDRGSRAPSDPEISVVVMSTNADPDALEAIRSVQAVADGLRVEIIAVNTGRGSLRDVLAPVLDEITLVETPSRQFAGGTRNLGVARSSAPIVAFLAADCLATRGWLRKRLEAHKAGHLTVASALRPFSSSRSSWASYALIHFNRMPEQPTKNALLYSLSYDRSLFERFGGFDETLRIGEDSAFNKQCASLQMPFWDPGIVTLHRYTDGLLSGLADQYARGLRSAAHLRSSKKSVARHLMGRTKRAIAIAWFLRTGFDPRAARSRWLVPVLFMGYALGTISAYVPGARGRAVRSV